MEKEWRGNEKIFRGYFHGMIEPGDRHSRPAEKVKDRPGHPWDEVKDDVNFGAVLQPKVICISLDYSDCSWFVQMIEDNNWHCLILPNPASNHLATCWREPPNWKWKDGADKRVACGIKADIHHGDTYIPLRVKGIDRFSPVHDFADENGEYDEVPPELFPVYPKDGPEMLGMGKGDGRNDALSAAVKKLYATGRFTRDRIRDFAYNVDHYIFAKSFEDTEGNKRGIEEMETILRDETFDKVDVENKSHIQIVHLSDVKPKEIEFLYDPYIPRGKISLVGAYPGVGKTFLCCYLAACVSNGKPFFDVPYGLEEPGKVLYITTEDGLADTIAQRLIWCHADMDMIYSIEDPKAELKFSAVSKFEQLLIDVDPVLVILDPFQSFLGGKVDGNSANEIRALLNPMIALAEKYNTAFIFICHYNKNSKGDSITRIIGSMDTVAAARSYMALGNVPKKTPEQKYMSQEKSSGRKAGDTILFHIDPEHGGIVYDGVTTMKEADYAALRRSGNKNSDLIVDAETLIRENLKGGRCVVSEIQALAKEEGISPRTLSRARHELGMISKRDGFGKNSKCYWVMPTLEDVTAGVDEMVKALDTPTRMASMQKSQ